MLRLKSSLAKSLLLVSVGLGALACASQAAAQSDVSASPAAVAPVGRVDEVVVTARRRAENIERVPVTITALSAKQLSDRQVKTQSDLQLVAPGLTVKATENRNYFSYSVRGQTVDYASGSLPGVLSYVDDFQINALSPSSFYDLASVQVLKGPQGTLFGRNATGGAVLFTTQQPVDRLSGYAQISYGNYNYREFQGALNMPLSESLAVRLAFDSEARDGYVKNLVYNSHLNADNNNSGRLSIRWEPTPKFKTTLVAQYDTASNGGDAFIGYAVNPVGAVGPTGQPLLSTAESFYSPYLDTLSGAPGAYAALLASLPPNVRAYTPYPGIGQAVADQKRRSVWDIANDSPSYHRSYNWFVTDSSSYEISSNLRIKNVIGYARAYTSDLIDQDGTAFPLMQFATQTLSEQYSEEFQLLGNAFDKKLDYITGIYLSSQNSTPDLHPRGIFEVGPVADPIFGTPSAPEYKARMTNRTEGVFAQGNYNLSSVLEGLKATAGIRYTWEQVYADENVYPGVAPGINGYAQSSNPSWEVGLQYQASPELMLYVTQRGSWRSGGFNQFADPRVNGLATVGGNEFAAETTKDVEVGVKFQGRVGGMPVRLNVDAFSQWTDGLQHAIYMLLPTGTLGTFTINSPKVARFMGVDLDADIHPTSWLTIGGSGSAIDPEYGRNNTVNAFNNSITFDTFADTPRFTGTVYAAVDIPLPNRYGELSLRGDYYAQTGSYFSNSGKSLLPGTELPGYQLANFRASWNHIMDSHVSMSIWVKNAFDQQYYVGGVATQTQVGISQAVAGTPRFFGVDLTVQY